MGATLTSISGAGPAWDVAAAAVLLLLSGSGKRLEAWGSEARRSSRSSRLACQVVVVGSGWMGDALWGLCGHAEGCEEAAQQIATLSR